ncbi:8-amino-3,8-dideoxy-manno-octulosonate cytidylyltransferase [Firmicutes bacterium ASF500]|nr:8-amino-3,8-dideoxy-manno-octulosonate cytidylyltransferase [Firmicutes bacterium ASF500]
MESKVLAIIQARMSSTRLPGKVLRNLCGQPILYHIVQRIRSVQSVDTIVIATSQNKSDDPIAEFAHENQVCCFRGSETDVLDRFFQAARTFGAEPDDIVMRLTADNPFVDPNVCEELLSYFKGSNFSYASAGGYPLGVGAEVFTFRALAEAHENGRQPYEREHVTPYMYREGQNPGKLNSPKDYSAVRLTVDTEEDYEVAQILYGSLYQPDRIFSLDEIIDYLVANPEVMTINKNVHQKRLGE